MDPKEEISRLAYEMQLYQQQGAALQQQMSALQVTIADYTSSIETLEGISDMKEKEVLLPVGSGVYVNARLTDTEKVMLNIGSDVVAQKSPAEAAEFLARKKKALEITRDRVQKNIIDINARLTAIDSAAKKIMDRGSDVQSP